MQANRPTAMEQRANSIPAVANSPGLDEDNEDMHVSFGDEAEPQESTLSTLPQRHAWLRSNTGEPGRIGDMCPVREQIPVCNAPYRRIQPPRRCKAPQGGQTGLSLAVAPTPAAAPALSVVGSCSAQAANQSGDANCLDSLASSKTNNTNSGKGVYLGDDFWEIEEILYCWNNPESTLVRCVVKHTC